MVEYEWVVERIDADSEDILDCSYWPENQRAAAMELANAWGGKDGERIDFGLCRNHYADGYLMRGYAYVDEAGIWPKQFDDPHKTAIPVRFKLWDAK